MSKLKTTFNVAIAELFDVPNSSESHNPFVTIAKFIFADDKPNGNKQGVKVEEFPNIIKTAIGMPVKMNFIGETVANHAGSVPVGHITKMEHVEEGERNTLVAEAMLWNDEFPDEIEWLKRAYAEKKAPNLSYELEYKEDVVENGVNWKKDVTTLGATFVHTAAYGSRTHLIALAALNEEERNNGIVALAEKIKADQEPSDNSDDEGGNRMDELEKANAEIKRLTEALAASEGKVTTLQAEVTKSEDEKKTVMAELEKIQTESMVNDRIRQYVEAGFTLETDATKAEARKAVFASYDEAQWETYLSDLKAVKPKDDKRQVVLASLRTTEIPKPEVELEGLTGLRDEMRGLARPHEIN